MFKYTVDCVDYNGSPYSEDLYFNLSKGEMAELELSYKEGLDKVIERMTAEENTPEMALFFKDILLKAYGKKSEDGRKFIKNQQMIDDFVQSDAYSEFFYKLLTDENLMESFTQGILPKIPSQSSVVPA